jgi:hypothetical protein
MDEGSRGGPRAGTSKGHAPGRLGRGRPEPYERVIAGELRPHRAIVGAGFAPEAITIPADPEDVARRPAKPFGRIASGP